MPHVLIIAGPNGAGKTTFVRRFWPRIEYTHVFVNADEVARDIKHTGLSGPALDLAAGRKVIQMLNRLTAERRDMVIETTLTGSNYVHRVPAWRAMGYFSKLVYLKLPSVEASIARVAHRVSHGGHGIPEIDLRRRFDRSLANLEIYKPLVDDWEVWTDINGEPTLLEAGRP